MSILKAKNLSKIYGSRLGARYKALDQFNITVEKGEFIAIMALQAVERQHCLISFHPLTHLHPVSL